MDWSTTNTAMMAGAGVAIYEDFKATKGAVKAGAEETNPFLSKRPSDQELDTATVRDAALVAGAAFLMPSQYRDPFLGATAGYRLALAYKADRQDPKAKKTDFWHSGLEGPILAAGAGALLGHYMDKHSQDSSTRVGFDFGKARDEKGRFVAVNFETKF